MADTGAEAFLRAVVKPRRRDPPRLAASLHAVERRDVHTRHGRLAAWRIGTGPATLLVHGWEDDNSLWEPMIAALLERNLALVVFDLPAHGFSEGDSGLGFEAAQAMHAVAAELGPLGAVVGHSMGAAAAVLAVKEGMEVQHCVLIAPPLRGGDRWRRLAERAGVGVETADAARVLYEERIGVATAGFDMGHDLARLAVDVLLVHSKDDERMPVEDSRAAADQASNVTLLLVDGYGHRQTAGAPEVTTGIADLVGPATR